VKRTLAVLVGTIVGVLLAGIVSPMLMMMVPPALRGPRLIESTVAVVVALSVWAGWTLSRPQREGGPRAGESR
jgi:hypothetical protein